MQNHMPKRSQNKKSNNPPPSSKEAKTRTKTATTHHQAAPLFFISHSWPHALHRPSTVHSSPSPNPRRRLRVTWVPWVKTTGVVKETLIGKGNKEENLWFVGVFFLTHLGSLGILLFGCSGCVVVGCFDNP